MSDGISLLLTALLAAIVASVAAHAVGRIRPSWSVHRTAFLSATPLPAAGIIFCAYVIVDVSRQPKAECGVDACAMAAAGATLLIAICAVLFVVGYAAAMISQRVCDRR
jgi:hypothetical protein